MQLSRMGIGALTAFALDQVSKFVVVHWLDLASINVIPIAPPYLVFAMAWNEGIHISWCGPAGRLRPSDRLTASSGTG